MNVRSVAGRRNWRSMQKPRKHNSSLAWLVATRGQAMLGVLGGRRGPSGSVEQYGSSFAIANRPAGIASNAATGANGSTAATIAMFQQHGHPGSCW